MIVRFLFVAMLWYRPVLANGIWKTLQNKGEKVKAYTGQCRHIFARGDVNIPLCDFPLGAFLAP